jgi:hypothetical protein
MGEQAVSYPPIREVVKATRLAIAAHEYDQDFYPNDDGYAGYSNDAKGELWECTKDWSRTNRNAFADAFEGQTEHATVKEVVQW